MPRTRSLAWSQLKVGILAVAALVLGRRLRHVGRRPGVLVAAVPPEDALHRHHGPQDRRGRAGGGRRGRHRGHASSSSGAEVEVVLSVQKEMQPLITDATRGVDRVAEPARRRRGRRQPVGTGRAAARTGARCSRDGRTGSWATWPTRATKGLAQATGLLADMRAGKGTVGRLFTDDQFYRDVNAFVASAEDVVASLNRARARSASWSTTRRSTRRCRPRSTTSACSPTRLNKGEGSLGAADARTTAFAQSLTATTKNMQELTRAAATAARARRQAAHRRRALQAADVLDRAARRDHARSCNDGEGTAGRLLQDKQLYENMNTAVTELRGLRQRHPPGPEEVPQREGQPVLTPARGADRHLEERHVERQRNGGVILMAFVLGRHRRRGHRAAVGAAVGRGDAAAAGRARPARAARRPPRPPSRGGSSSTASATRCSGAIERGKDAYQRARGAEEPA